MERSSWCPEAEARPDDPSAVVSSDDWRKQLLPEARQRIVNKIMDTLKRHLPVSGPEGLNELKKIAERFEEKIYRAAINQSDYLRKISFKMLSMETKSRGVAAISPSLSNPTIGNQSPSESVAVNSTIQTGLADTVPVNSTTQTGNTDSVDWQEEVYQKVKSMKEFYYDQICELQQLSNLKIQQLTQTNALVPLARPSELLEKLKQFVLALERTKMFLQITKDNIPSSLKDKLPLFEKQIASFVAHYRIMKLKLEEQEFQHQPSQISTTSMQQGSTPLSINATVPATQPNIASALQPPSLGQMEGNSFSSLQLGAIGPMQNGGFGSLQNSYQPSMFSGFGSLKNYASANQQRAIESQLQLQQRLLEQQNQLLSIQQKQRVPVQMNGASQGFGSGLDQPYFPVVPQQNYYQPLKPSGLFPVSPQQNLQTAPLQSSAQVDKILMQPTSSAVASPRFMPIASLSLTEKHSGTSKSVSTESRVTADQIAALENRAAALKDRVASLEKSLSVILCAIFFALFVGSYFLW